MLPPSEVVTIIFQSGWAQVDICLENSKEQCHKLASVSQVLPGGYNVEFLEMCNARLSGHYGLHVSVDTFSADAGDTVIYSVADANYPYQENGELVMPKSSLTRWFSCRSRRSRNDRRAALQFARKSKVFSFKYLPAVDAASECLVFPSR